MKRTFEYLLALYWCVMPWATAEQGLTTAEAPAEPAAQTEAPAEWMVELSNMPAEKRAEYAAAFAQAKQAYATGRLIECECHLNTCEFFTRKNPHVWNLRAGALVMQRRFEEARPLLAEVQRVSPQDEVARMSLSMLYLGTAEYEKCLEETERLLVDIRYRNLEQLTHSLMFRKLLCYMMLGREAEARELVKGVGPIDDSPLYYYSQAVFFLAKGDRRSAVRDMGAADAIYANTGHLAAYKQALEFSGVAEKFAEARP